MKVQECGVSDWDETQHALDFPGLISTTDFKVTEKGHERIADLYRTYCRQRVYDSADRTPPEVRIARWIRENCASFVFIQTSTTRATVISFEDTEDAKAFRREFAHVRG